MKIVDRKLFLLEGLELGLGLNGNLLHGCLLLSGNRCCSAGKTDIQTTLFTGGCIFVNDSLLGSLVELGNETLKESLHFFRTRGQSFAQFLFISLEAAQNTDIVCVALFTLAGALDSGAAFLDGCFCGGHWKE